MPRLFLVTGRCCRLPCAIQPAIAVRFAQLRSLVFLQRLGRTLEFEQHVAEQLACGQEPPRRDDVLLAFVLDVGRLAHECERVVALLLRERYPGDRRHSHHLDFVRPVLVVPGLLRRLQLVSQHYDPVNVLLRRGSVPAPRRTERAREMRHRLSKRVRRQRLLEFRRLAPGAALDDVARRHCRERVWPGGAGWIEPGQPARLVQDLARVAVAGELQVGVGHVVQRVQRIVGLVVLLRDCGRAPVGRHRVGPRADAGEDVGGHV